MKKKKAFTLLEIMIVIFLIGLIGSVVGYNMKGSLEEGKAFKTKQAREKLREILELEIAKGSDPERVVQDPKSFLHASGLVNKPEKMILDGWGEKFDVTLTNGEVKISSKKFETFKNKKRARRGRDLEDG